MKYGLIITVTVILTGAFAWLAWAYPSAELTIPPTEIIFSHSFHVADMETDCLACHPKIETSAKADEKNLPTMDECGACHDVGDDEQCVKCHRNPEEFGALINPERTVLFNHQAHISQKMACPVCHGDVAHTETLTAAANLPDKPLCMSCHDGVKADSKCALCHGEHITLEDIHPADWRHQHGEMAKANETWCNTCHVRETDCVRCHRGDNLRGNIHDLNYKYSHGLDARSKQMDCFRCHDVQSFCNDCHVREHRMPYNHSTLSWASEHGMAARDDIENCASCHDAADPTCARAGCHNDFDGLRGTNPRFHSDNGGVLSSHGPWHDDGGYYCYTCHRNTGHEGEGFCSYCHDSERD